MNSFPPTSRVHRRRPYWPVLAWIVPVACFLGLLFKPVGAYSPGYYVFWAALPLGALFVSRRWSSVFALAALGFAVACGVHDHRIHRYNQEARMRPFYDQQARDWREQHPAPSPSP